MQVRHTPVYVAHRGHGSQPENTMAAFAKGLEAGADRIELDIQKSADGDYVVIHDPTVDRTTNGTGKVAELSTQALRQLDAGNGQHLPLLSEVIDWAKQRDVALNIEVKHPHQGDEIELANIVSQSGLRDPLVMSFNADFMERFEKQAPQVTSGVLVSARPLLPGAATGAAVGLASGLTAALVSGMSSLPLIGTALAGLVGGAAVGYAATLSGLRRKEMDREVDIHIPAQRLISPGTIERAHQHGKEVGTYTVDDPNKADKFKRWGIDALITNYPERVGAGQA